MLYSKATFALFALLSLRCDASRIRSDGVTGRDEGFGRVGAARHVTSASEIRAEFTGLRETSSGDWVVDESGWESPDFWTEMFTEADKFSECDETLHQCLERIIVSRVDDMASQLNIIKAVIEAEFSVNKDTKEEPEKFKKYLNSVRQSSVGDKFSASRLIKGFWNARTNEEMFPHVYKLLAEFGADDASRNGTLKFQDLKFKRDLDAEIKAQIKGNYDLWFDRVVNALQ